MDTPSDKKNDAALVGFYRVLDPVRIPSADSTDEIAAEDILEALNLDGSQEFPSIAPVALSVTPPPVAVEPEPETAPAPSPAPRSAPTSLAPWILGTIAAAVLAGLAILVALRFYDTRGPRAVSSVIVVEQRSAPVRDESGIPVVPLDNLPVAPPTRGTLRFPDAAKRHRVFVDGAVVGDADGPIEVACGRRMIRVGSRGVARPIDVPCGGDVVVTLR